MGKSSNAKWIVKAKEFIQAARERDLGWTQAIFGPYLDSPRKLDKLLDAIFLVEQANIRESRKYTQHARKARAGKMRIMQEGKSDQGGLRDLQAENMR